MKDLQNYRNQINGIDQKMADLFCERMDVVKKIAQYKKEHGLNVFDAKREAKVIEENTKRIADEELKAFYIGFLKGTMEVSSQYQRKLIQGLKVACSGVEGAFAHIAATRIFPNGSISFFNGFSAAYSSVEKGECDCCVLPIENSYAGEVTQVTDLIFSGSLYINGVYDLQICHNLLGLPNAEIGDIQTVLSHPQALSQCEGYIRAHKFRKKEQINTAVAAQTVAQGNDPTVAAIASKETAQLYGLKVLDHDINASNANTTRFAVFSRAENVCDSADSKFIMVFTVRNEAGALAKAINIIGEHGFNMRVLRSRPVKEEPWQYYFYVEAEGNAYGEHAKQMLGELAAQCDKVKIVGSFSDEDKL